MTDSIREKIFNTLKKNIKKFSPPMVQYDSAHHDLNLIGNKAVPYGSDKKIIPGMYFASIAHRKQSVTFHFFPCYLNTRLKSIAPTLYKCLKGKTCFHFKKPDQVNEKELQTLLKAGVRAWKKAGYMK